MPIEYEEIDASKVEADVMRQRALEAEDRAFRAECVAEAMAAMAERASGYTDVADQANTSAAIERGRATRAAGAAGVDLTKKQVEDTHRAFLKPWKAQIEAEHVAHSAQAAERERVLAMPPDDPAAPTEDDRARIEANLETNRRSIAELEASWAIAKSRLEGMPDPEEQAAGEAPKRKPRS